MKGTMLLTLVTIYRVDNRVWCDGTERYVVLLYYRDAKERPGRSSRALDSRVKIVRNYQRISQRESAKTPKDTLFVALVITNRTRTCGLVCPSFRIAHRTCITRDDFA